jgi:hypothetical protein
MDGRQTHLHGYHCFIRLSQINGLSFLVLCGAKDGHENTHIFIDTILGERQFSSH